MADKKIVISEIFPNQTPMYIKRPNLPIRSL